MRLGATHLTYCTNIHPAETADAIIDVVRRHVPAVKAEVCPAAPFGVGLRVGARAAAEFASSPALVQTLKRALTDGDLYVFTLNGFPHGAFSGRPVKTDVYRPDWLEPARLEYTVALASLLADLLPQGIEAIDGIEAVEGSISTVPLAFAARVGGEEDDAKMATALLACAEQLAQIEARTGRRIRLALEPEPACRLETTDQVIEFFERYLLGDARTDYIGVCLDACHAAVEMESAADVVAKLRSAGVSVPKIQLSAALRIPVVREADIEALRAFDEPVYLHQVVARTPDGIRRYVDLPEAFAAFDGREQQWRVHFHVPIFLDRLGSFSNTQPFLRDLLAIQRTDPISNHLEVETYTWDVLPAEYRNVPVARAIAREIRWAQEQL